MHSCSVTQLCPTLCNPVKCSMPGFPVLHDLPEFAQTHAHWISDAIQPSHPLSSPSPLALSLFQHQDLFQWIGSSCQVAKVLELQLQHQCFQWLFRVNILWDWLIWSSWCPRDSQESSTTPSLKAMSNQNLNWYSASSQILHIATLDLSLLLLLFNQFFIPQVFLCTTNKFVFQTISMIMSPSW